MKIYIRSAACLSPQPTFNTRDLLDEPAEYVTNRLKVMEPDYKPYIDAKLIRRMSRLIRMGVAAALQCLSDAGIDQPDAIITGTAYGCLEDTGVFLSRITEQQEEMLSPTAFIQSTHNTVGAQIALSLQCRNYNNTFTQRGHSFESALLDAILLLNEQEASHVLVGSADELTGISFDILSRFGLFRRTPVSNLSLYETTARGTVAGEGTAFFALSAEAGERNLARLDALETFYLPREADEAAQRILSFFEAHQLKMTDIDLLLTGKNGDSTNDAFYQQLQTQVFNGAPAGSYKHLCGEYPTSVSFALWLAAEMLHTGHVPQTVADEASAGHPVNRILIYNFEPPRYHTLLLLSTC